MAKGTTSNYRMNDQIRIPQVRLIDENNNQVGIVDTYEALGRARDAGMDLVEVARTERPPVCRIMDYGKFKYHIKKKGRKSHEQVLKEVRMRPKTDDNDRMIKIDRALKFLGKGDKVQFTMQFRGRERAHREVGAAIFQRVIKDLGDLVKVERPPSMDGRHMIMILAPNKKEFDAYAAKDMKVTLTNLVREREELALVAKAKTAQANEAADQALEESLTNESTDETQTSVSAEETRTSESIESATPVSAETPPQ